MQNIIQRKVEGDVQFLRLKSTRMGENQTSGKRKDIYKKEHDRENTRGILP
jgi:hypothetical protein